MGNAGINGALQARTFARGQTVILIEDLILLLYRHLITT